MKLNRLSLTNFRNFARLDVDIPGGPVLLVGGNAQGKTSLLESIYYTATFVSFRANHDRQIVNFLINKESLAVARVKLDFCYTSNYPDSGIKEITTQRIEVRLILESKNSNNIKRFRKEILLDGVKRKASEVLGAFNAVLFLPQMLRIVEGGPDERRRYINIAMSQVLPRFAMNLSEYRRIVSQRNALLKQINERGGDKKQLDYWDEQLSKIGAYIIHNRIQVLQNLERLASRIHGELTQGKEVLRFDYKPSYNPISHSRQYTLPLESPILGAKISLKEIQNGFVNELRKMQSEEIRRGVTTIGPHRDELRFLSNGIDLGEFGSRGQARTAVLALKFAEVEWMKMNTGQWPVILLDEVLSELDPIRRLDLLSRLKESEQVLITTTDLDLFKSDFSQNVVIWQIENGRVSELNK
jgi:DNA replication and repair protein RecF